MPSTKKLVSYRRAQFGGTRRSKPRVRELNRATRERIEHEHQIVQALIRDADVRRVLVAGRNTAAPPFSVWNDLDQPPDATELRPQDLPRWRDVGEYLKVHLLLLIALDDGGYSFTARIRPDLEAKWKLDRTNPMERITRQMRKALNERGLADLEYCYMVESRTKRGSQASLHLHGLLLTRTPLTATRFKAAVEKAIAAHSKGKAAAGYAMKSGDPVETAPVYDMPNSSRYGRNRWATYITKNALLHDKRMARRVFISRTATQTAREFWALVREDPLP